MSDRIKELLEANNRLVEQRRERDALLREILKLTAVSTISPNILMVKIGEVINNSRLIS